MEFVAAHWLLSSTAALLIIALIVNELVLSRRAGPRIGATQAVRLINDDKARVVDLRSAADYKKGHILGAENIPLQRLTDKQDQLLKERDRPVVLVCALGSMAASAARQLRAAGHSAVYPLSGGLNAWETAGLPLTRQSSPK